MKFYQIWSHWTRLSFVFLCQVTACLLDEEPEWPWVIAFTRIQAHHSTLKNHNEIRSNWQITLASMQKKWTTFAVLKLMLFLYSMLKFWGADSKWKPYLLQAIIEAPNQQLNLCDIYAWFQANFLHFRSSNLTWKVKNEKDIHTRTR